MGKSTISMAIFNSYVKLPEGITGDYRIASCFKGDGLHLRCVLHNRCYAFCDESPKWVATVAGSGHKKIVVRSCCCRPRNDAAEPSGRSCTSSPMVGCQYGLPWILWSKTKSDIYIYMYILYYIYTYYLMLYIWYVYDMYTYIYIQYKQHMVDRKVGNLGHSAKVFLCFFGISLCSLSLSIDGYVHAYVYIYRNKYTMYTYAVMWYTQS